MMTKEELKKRRKEVYQKAKARRDADPEYIALKEKQKESRQAQYQAIKAKRKQAKEEEQLKARAEKDAALMALLKPASELGKKEF